MNGYKVYNLTSKSGVFIHPNSFRLQFINSQFFILSWGNLPSLDILPLPRIVKYRTYTFVWQILYSENLKLLNSVQGFRDSRRYDFFSICVKFYNVYILWFLLDYKLSLSI